MVCGSCGCESIEEYEKYSESLGRIRKYGRCKHCGGEDPIERFVEAEEYIGKGPFRFREEKLGK